MATHDRKDTKVLAAVLFSGNVFCPRVMVKNGTKFACVLMIPRVAQGLSVLQKHWTENVATKSLHKRQKLLFCSRIKCIHHIIIARIFVAWFPLFGCFALILKDGFGRGEGMSLEKQRCKGKKIFCLQVHQTL